MLIWNVQIPVISINRTSSRSGLFIGAFIWSLTTQMSAAAETANVFWQYLWEWSLGSTNAVHRGTTVLFWYVVCHQRVLRQCKYRISNELSFITKFITFVGKNDIMLGRASHNIMFANSCNKFSNKWQRIWDFIYYITENYRNIDWWLVPIVLFH